ADAAHREAAASFQAWAAGGPAKAIKAALDTPGVTWERLHQQVARYGLHIEPKGSGMVVTTRLDDGRTLAAKASQLGRWASKAELEKRLGPWQPPPDKLPAASVSYQKSLDAGRLSAQADGPVRGLIADERTARRLERSAARKVLAARFKAEQDTARQDRPKQRAALVQQHRAERAALTVQLREERKALTAQAQQSGQPLAVVQSSLWALRAAQQREALQKRQAAQRKALSVKLPKQEVWRKWVEREAAQGDEAAQAALRGIRYRERRKKNQQVDGIEGEELDPLRKLTLAGLEAQIDHKRQTVLYRGTDGRERFTDTGPRIVLHDKGDDSLEAALRLAAQKYGGKVDITGSSEFRERAARQAVRLGLEVMDADLQAVVQDERQRRQTSRQAVPAVSRAVPPDEQEQPRPHLLDVLRGTTARQIEAEAEARAKRVAEIIARAEAAETEAETGPPGMRAVDAALAAWQQALTDAARTRAVQDWMRGMERIEQQGGDVAAANAHSRKALGGRYAGFMREVGGLARQRVQHRENDRGMSR
ncbi:MAG: relaxase/mobilization nuclease, partial [Burkholderiaceae bacterium]|nr:relaxase/mobilization nuclease [Burkholderiaceae bacterium]